MPKHLKVKHAAGFELRKTFLRIFASFTNLWFSHMFFLVLETFSPTISFLEQCYQLATTLPSNFEKNRSRDYSISEASNTRLFAFCSCAPRAKLRSWLTIINVLVANTSARVSVQLSSLLNRERFGTCFSANVRIKNIFESF